MISSANAGGGGIHSGSSHSCPQLEMIPRLLAGQGGKRSEADWDVKAGGGGYPSEAREL